METKEYKLLDGRTIRAKYNRLGRCNISKENLEEFVKEFNVSYRQAKILEKIKENYALMKADEHKKGRWIKEKTIHGWDGFSYQCSECGRSIHLDTEVEDLTDYPYCHCGSLMESE